MGKLKAVGIFGLLKRRIAFTMAEILLSLTIIGVVAAITLPSLMGNINERTWNTQRKALYARMSQAISLVPSIGGFGSYNVEVYSHPDFTLPSTRGVDTATETFIVAALSKVLKMNNICDAPYQDCGFPSTFNTMTGEQLTAIHLLYMENLLNRSYTLWGGNGPQGKAFETMNGETILAFYSPACYPLDSSGNLEHSLCAYFIYDLNGLKGPNTVGKDMGVMAVMSPFDSRVVAPIPLMNDAGKATQREAGRMCTNQNPDSRVPNLDELATMVFLNALYFGDMSSLSDGYWSSTVETSTKAWAFSPDGWFSLMSRNLPLNVRCVKRYN